MGKQKAGRNMKKGLRLQLPLSSGLIFMAVWQAGL